MVTISITQPAGTIGSFAAFSHREDCVTAPVNCPVNNFGLAHDLAVGFDPLSGPPPVTSPIVIAATFSSPFPGLKFEISDVDFGGAPGTDPTGHRLDRVTVTSDEGNPTLAAKIAPPTTFTIGGNVATAVCTGSEATNCTPADDTANPNTDKGTVLVDFSALPPVTTVTINYTEVSNQPDPAARGIGVFGNLTPVELISFTVD